MKKCDLCNQPAVVHETTVKNGVTRELHLCSECASKAGVVVPGQPKPVEVLQHFVIAGPEEQARPSNRGRRMACQSCGMTFAQFRRSGTLGCPNCYEGFGRHLSALIERAQAGATHHCGKTPRAAGSSIDRQARISKLLRELNSAVAAEQYERAAELRDRLHELKRGDSSVQTGMLKTSQEERSV